MGAAAPRSGNAGRTARFPRRCHDGPGVPAAGITIGGLKWTGSFTTINLIAATTNALNGALLARRPDRYKNFTVTGILLMALICGIGGGSPAT